jgi:hypothetical protein
MSPGGKLPGMCSGQTAPILRRGIDEEGAAQSQNTPDETVK